MTHLSTIHRVALRQTLSAKLFVSAVVASPFLAFFTHSGIIAYGPIFVGGLMVLTTVIVFRSQLALGDWGAVLVSLPYTIIAALAYTSSALGEGVLTGQMASFLIIPLTVLSLVLLYTLCERRNYVAFITNILLLFVAAELLICLGQFSSYFFGVGFHVTEKYADKFQISGTFYNSNDLGATILLAEFVFAMCERYVSPRKKVLFWVIAVSTIVLSVSRSSVLVTAIIFAVTRRWQTRIRKRSIRTLTLTITATVVLYMVASNFMDTDVASRIVNRLDSITTIFESGVSASNSWSMRLHSYLFFFQNLQHLGFGTWEIKDYSAYSGGALWENAQMFFRVPHSLIVELGYWLGWPGLGAFLGLCLYLLRYSRGVVLLILVLAVSSSVPSSILGSIHYIMFFLMCFFASRFGRGKRFNEETHPNT